MPQNLRVLHIDTEKTWRGGENQLRLLLEGGRDQCEWYLACPPDSEAKKRLHQFAQIYDLPRGVLGAVIGLRGLIRFCKDHQIQIIDCQTSKAHGIGLMLKSWLPHLRLIVHRRVDFSPGKGFFSRRKYLSPKVDAYIAISQAIADILTAYGITSSKVHVVKSAVDPTPFTSLDHHEMRGRLVEEFHMKESIPIIANVAYHTEQKGHHTLLKALSRLRQQGLDFVCLLIGKGPLTQELIELSHKLNLLDQVKFLGLRQDIPRILVGSDIFAMPSNFEGLGTSILDAIYSGCAVAATRVGGIPEMIRHEETGLLSEVSDDEGHALQLARLIQDPILRRKLAMNAQNKIANDFALDNMVKGNLAVYRSFF